MAKNIKAITAPLTAFDSNTYNSICDQLAKADKDLRSIIANHGYPPMWTRANNLETLDGSYSSSRFHWHQHWLRSIS